jgi:hypothetical protein
MSGLIKLHWHTSSVNKLRVLAIPYTFIHQIPTRSVSSTCIDFICMYEYYMQNAVT